ncbi:MAG: glycosyltransferase family 39 protein [Candidatus Omnitrophica bacterium]|nr:glycosyltransferase family 39 protein [Candidatus Omnitrophota bacterium]
MNRFYPITLTIVLLALAAMMFVGLTSEPFLGDEIHHYRFAKDIYTLRDRPTMDLLYAPQEPGAYFYATEPLWPIGLAILWKLTGGIASYKAQVYHFGFFLLLLVGVFKLARKLYGEKCGLFAALLTLTMPMMIAFGVLFYVDMPAAALCVWFFLLLREKKYAWSGFFLGLLYLMKRSSLFFIPGIFFLIFTERSRGFWGRVLASFFCFGIALMVVTPDIIWRQDKFGSFVAAPYQRDLGERSMTTREASGGAEARDTSFGGIRGAEIKIVLKFLQRTLEQIYHFMKKRIRAMAQWKFWTVTEYLNSSLLDPKDIVTYFGLATIICFFLYLLGRRFHSSDIFLWVPILSYMFFYAFLLRLGSDIRYTFPVIPLLIILGAKGLEGISGTWYKYLIYVICVLQFLSVLLFVSLVRRPSKALVEGFAYIRAHTPEEALIMYPESNILEETNRKVIWGLGEVLHIMRKKDEGRIAEIIQNNHLDYIVIKKDRVYEDYGRGYMHHGGYPRSFVERLGQYDFLECEFDNPAMSVWKIKHELLA